MAPRLVLKQQCQRKLTTKTVNHALIINTKLRKKIMLLSNQNKELSITRNNLLLNKLELQYEINSINNSNIELTTMYCAISKKLDLLEQNMKTCLSSLVTMSTCLPKMMENVCEMRQLENQYENFHCDIKQKKKKHLKPMVNGLTITHPAVSLSQLDLSTISESFSPEKTPEQLRRSTTLYTRRSSPQCKLNSEPYARLKDVKLLSKVSKTVPSENAYNQQDENLGEGPSWLHSQENKIENPENKISVTNSLQTSTSNDFQEEATSTMSTSTHKLSLNVSPRTNTRSSMNNSVNETNVRNTFIEDSSMLKNISCRKQPNRRSNDTSVASDIDVSAINVSAINVSARSRRTTTKSVHYKEPTLKTKLRRT